MSDGLKPITDRGKRFAVRTILTPRSEHCLLYTGDQALTNPLPPRGEGS